jgi:hypothetical protein
MGIFELAPAILIPVAGMIFVGAIVITPMVLRSQERQRMHNTIRRLHEEGQTISPELLATLGNDDLMMSRLPQTPMADLRRGLILLAVAAGMVCLGFAIDAGSANYTPIWPLIGASAFPGLIGVAFLIMWQMKLSSRQA